LEIGDYYPDPDPGTIMNEPIRLLNNDVNFKAQGYVTNQLEVALLSVPEP